MTKKEEEMWSKDMTQEESLAITRLAIKIINRDDRFGNKFYKYDDGKIKYDSTTDARTALEYVIRIYKGENYGKK